MRHRQKVSRLLGETFREIGILALVLAPLDATFSNSEFSAWHVLASMVIGVTMIGLGIMMETRS